MNKGHLIWEKIDSPLLILFMTLLLSSTGPSSLFKYTLKLVQLFLNYTSDLILLVGLYIFTL